MRVDTVADIVETTLRFYGYQTKRITPSWFNRMRDDALIIECDGKKISLTRVNTSGEQQEVISRIEEWVKPFPRKR